MLIIAGGILIAVIVLGVAWAWYQEQQSQDCRQRMTEAYSSGEFDQMPTEC